MPARCSLVAVLVLALAGCGEEAKTPEPELEDPPGYFGLSACSCYLYRTDGSPEKLGVAIERMVDRGGGLQTYELRYRNDSGQVFRTELVQPTSPDLLLWDVQYAGGVPAWRLDAGLPLVRWPPEGREGTPVTETTPGAYRESSTQQDPTAFQMSLRSDYGALADVSYELGGEQKTAKGVRVTYLLSSDVAQAPTWSLGPHTFVPEVGFTRLEQLDTGTGLRIWNLYDVKPIEGCPFTGPPPPTQICGLSIQ